MNEAYGIAVQAALFGAPLMGLALFLILPPRRAVLAGVIGAWLFLPVAGFELRGVPDYTKMTATMLGPFLGALIFDLRSFMAVRPRLSDLFMLVWCVAPVGSSLSNGLGLYDGVSGTIDQMAQWGIPYLLGRAYFADLTGARELAIGMVVAGLIYVPLCLYEIRMSPQLHSMIYEFHQHSFAQTYRGGGWRPTVFLQHGLAVGLLMATASFVAIWLWLAGRLTRLASLPIALVLPVLLVTTVLCKSMGSIACLAAALAAAYASRLTRLTLPVLVMAAVPPVYVALRATGAWSGEPVVGMIEEAFPDRGASLRTRIDSENFLAEHAMRQPLFGWGGYGRNRPLDEEGNDLAITDGLWIIAFGQHGAVGLAGLITAMLWPAWRGIRYFPPSTPSPAGAAPAALAMVVIMYSCDNLLNAMTNPVFHLAIGGLAGIQRPWARPGAQAMGAPGRAGGAPIVERAR